VERVAAGVADGGVVVGEGVAADMAGRRVGHDCIVA
jgi:hypothetical protein